MNTGHVWSSSPSPIWSRSGDLNRSILSGAHICRVGARSFPGMRAQEPACSDSRTGHGEDSAGACCRRLPCRLLRSILQVRSSVADHRWHSRPLPLFLHPGGPALLLRSARKERRWMRKSSSPDVGGRSPSGSRDCAGGATGEDPRRPDKRFASVPCVQPLERSSRPLSYLR